MILKYVGNSIMGYRFVQKANLIFQGAVFRQDIGQYLIQNEFFEFHEKFKTQWGQKEIVVLSDYKPFSTRIIYIRGQQIIININLESMSSRQNLYIKIVSKLMVLFQINYGEYHTENGEEIIQAAEVIVRNILNGNKTS